MDEKEYLANTINDQLSAGLPVVLISILNLEGSTPRHDGTKMAIGADGKTYGTIGGSLIEASAVKGAREALTRKESKIISFELSGKDASSPGMICGGKAEILLDYLTPGEQNKEFAKAWVKAIKEGKDFFILTHYKSLKASVEVLGHAIMDNELKLTPANFLSPSELEKLKPELHNVSTTSILALTDSELMVDRIRKLKTLICFGAGHVAVPTAHLAALVGFRVMVLDDRPEYANSTRFPEASKVVVVKDYVKAFEDLEIDRDSFIVIVTRGHQYDREVLDASLKTEAGYIGMISSKRKREAIYEALGKGGVKRERLNEVHSPIGIDIGGETPEEIAVSIVAELVKVRSELSK